MSKYNPRRAIYKVVDGHEIDVDVYLPSAKIIPGENNSPHPVLINIHGGAFMLGSSKMVNPDQVADCLERGWVVLAPNHRLCPQINLLDGPIQDCRDLLDWVHKGRLQDFISTQTDSPLLADLDNVFAMGTSSGGTLALCLGFGVSRPVAGIFDMYGPCKFSDPFWTAGVPSLAAKLPDLSDEFMRRVFQEVPIPIAGGISLEGQQHAGGPNFDDPRQAYALFSIAHGKIFSAIWPSKDWSQVDPVENITADFPPTFIVHGNDDEMVPFGISKHLYHTLSRHDVECQFLEVPGEGHTFAARMEKGSATWNLQQAGFRFLDHVLLMRNQARAGLM